MLKKKKHLDFKSKTINGQMCIYLNHEGLGVVARKLTCFNAE